MSPKFRDTWYYPPDIANDLNGVTQLPERFKEEAYACAWEYTRCVIPQYTNWRRYVAFMRIIIMGIIAEFRGDLVDVTASDSILGYSLDGTLAELFEGTPGHALMAREYKTFLLVTADKASSRRDGELFRRYVNALAISPRAWFRMRDGDALARFTMASALACNDLDDVWPTDQQFELLAEIGDTLYDAVAFYKHRSEGETNSTFAYVPPEIRIKAFRVAREVLWALDVAYAHKPEGAPLMNFVRYFGGPIHMMMRRYRFVEEDLTVGRPETDAVVTETRRHVKLWNRVDADIHDSNGEGQTIEASSIQRYHAVLKRSEELMFPELPELLERGSKPHCDRCLYRASYGAEQNHSFGGVALCRGCQAMWRGYVESLPDRTKEVFAGIVLKAPSGQEVAGPNNGIKNQQVQNGRHSNDDDFPSLPNGNAPLQNGHANGAVLVAVME